MPAQKRKGSLDGFITKKRKVADTDTDHDAKQSSSSGSSVIVSIKERPGIVATREAAAIVDAYPPHSQLLKAMESPREDGHFVEPQAGESVVYWMRMEDMRSQYIGFNWWWKADC
jgi:hypothetical protein